jgi:hypothetical protein
MINKVFTIAKPEKNCSSNKVWRKYSCMPSGITDVAKVHRYNSMQKETRGSKSSKNKKLPQNVANLLLYRSIKTQDRINSFIKG